MATADPRGRAQDQIARHQTRPSHPTAGRGVPIKVASGRLGHTPLAMTMDIYAHVLPAMDRNAARAIGQALGATMPERTDVDER